jgi:hypothetical protein
VFDSLADTAGTAAAAGQTYFVAALTSAVVAMAGALKMFWGYFKGVAEKTETKLAECEKGHAATTEKFVTLTGQVMELRGRMDERNEVADRLTLLHQDVLAIVRSANESEPNAMDSRGSGAGVHSRDRPDDRVGGSGVHDVGQ